MYLVDVMSLVDLSDKDCEICCCNVDISLYFGGGESKVQSPDPLE